MSILTRLRATAGFVARGSIRRAANRMLDQASDCRTAQREVLRQLLALNADSDFSRQHELDTVRDAADFRQRLPIADYEFFRAHIDRVRAGDHRAFLGSSNQLLMFSLTSGTTAQPKSIPITQRFLDDYRRGWHAWGIRMLDDHFSVNRKNIVQLVSDYEQCRTEGGTPCGNISGLVGAMQRKIVRLMYTLPLGIMKIEVPDAKYYTTLRIALNDRDVGLFTTASPSTLVRLAQLAEDRAEDLIRDVADGTLTCDAPIGGEVLRMLGPTIAKRRRRRARELERAVDRDGTLRPSGAWPDLELLAVWTGGSCRFYLDRLRVLYGDLPIRDHGLHASEGRMTIPLEDDTPSGVLDVTTHYFEFVPVAEHGKPNAVTLEAHELEEGGEYYILLTTSSGLCRYDIRDVVRCTGFHGTTPRLEFLHKGAHVASITGEKISESQVVTAVSESLNGNDEHAGEFAMAPVWGDPPGYQLLIEDRMELNGSALDELAAKVDRRLQEINPEYAEKRRSSRLAPLAGVRLADGTWSRFAREKQQRLGGSSEQYKHPCLVPDMDFAARIVALQNSRTAVAEPAFAETRAVHKPTKPSRERVVE